MILRSLWRHWLGFKMPRVPVVVVLGATGCGKSQLAVEIASKYKGEIISADAMQVYKDLDITTNKVTAEEMAGIPHHMLDFLDPKESFTVVDFRNRVLPIVGALRESGKLPVIVGGTNYYIESILWENLVNPEDHEQEALVQGSEPLSCEYEESSEALHARLKEIDPERANQIHPNDRRKIVRSLHIYEKNNRTHSEFLKKQKEAGGVLGGPLRYRDAVIFWIRSDEKVLDNRLDARVEKMIERGLVTEMLDFHKKFNESRDEPSYELGIFQSIGFKEFHKYLIASDDYRESLAGKKEFKSSLELMKQRTKRYAKYQVKWITKRFLQAPSREVPPLYALDGTDVEKWNDNVRDIALEIMEDTLGRVERPRHKPLEFPKVERAPTSTYECECGTICMNAISFEAHVKSRKHWRNMKELETSKNPPEHDTPDSKRQRTRLDPNENKGEEQQSPGNGGDAKEIEITSR